MNQLNQHEQQGTAKSTLNVVAYCCNMCYSDKNREAVHRPTYWHEQFELFTFLGGGWEFVLSTREIFMYILQRR